MDFMDQAIRLNASVVNFMPSMGSAKEALGLEKLDLTTLIGASLSCSRPVKKRKVGEVSIVKKSKTGKQKDMKKPLTEKKPNAPPPPAG